MKIEIEHLNKIIPNFRGNGHPCNLKIDIDVTESQMESIFYAIWEYCGDEIFEKWINAEGYKLINRAASAESQPANIQQAAIQNGLCEHGKPWGNFCKECGRGDGLVNK